MGIKSKVGLMVAAWGLASFAGVPAWSQTTAGANQPAGASAPSDVLEEILITASKTSTTDIQKTAGAVVAVTGSDLLQNGQDNISTALKDIPGVFLGASPSSSGYDLTIRGIGPTIPSFINGGGGVAFNFDGVYNNAPTTNGLGYYDLDRIELLLGPQGTLYGRAAEGGVMNVITHDPMHKFEVSGSLEVGNYDLVHLTGMINIPLSDNLALRVAGSEINRRGYLSNGQDDDVEQSVRAKLLYTPSDGTRILLGGEFFHTGGEGPAIAGAFGIPVPTQTQAYYYPNAPGVNNQYGYKAWAQFDQDLGFARLTVLPAYQNLGPNNDEVTGGPTDYTGAQDNIGLHGLWIQRSLEARLSSEASSAVQWVIGYFGYTSFEELMQENAIVVNDAIVPVQANPPIGANLSYSTNYAGTEGLFGQTTIPVAADTRLIVGARESRDIKKDTTTNVDVPLPAGHFSSFDYKLGVQHDLAANSMLYLTYATGYRPGGVDPLYPYSVYADEHLKSLEIGSKNEFLDHRLRLNADAYWYHYTGFQVQELSFDPTRFPAFELAIPNLPLVTNVGVDLAVQYLVTPDDKLSASVAYLNSRIGGDPTLDFIDGLPFYGKPLSQAPEWAVVFNPQHTFHLWNGATLTATPDIRYTTYYYIPVANPPPPPSQSIGPPIDYLIQPAYWDEDFSLAYAPAEGHWGISAYIRNISNQVVKVGQNGGLGAPRSFGVVFNASF